MERRFEALEVKVAYLEHLLAELDGELRTAIGRIEALESELAAARQSATFLGKMDPEAEKPPHY